MRKRNAFYIGMKNYIYLGEKKPNNLYSDTTMHLVFDLVKSERDLYLGW